MSYIMLKQEFASALFAPPPSNGLNHPQSVLYVNIPVVPFANCIPTELDGHVASLSVTNFVDVANFVTSTLSAWSLSHILSYAKHFSNSVLSQTFVIFI